MAQPLSERRDDEIHLTDEQTWAFFPEDASYLRTFDTEDKAMRFAQMWLNTRPRQAMPKTKPGPKKRVSTSRYENYLEYPVDGTREK
jgi:hypothetical protein